MECGNKGAKGETSGVIFHQFRSGVKTNRDAWVINFDQDVLRDNATRMVDTYNTRLLKWQQQTARDIDNFVAYDDQKINWCADLKQKLISDYRAEFFPEKIRQTLYRPFTKSQL